MRTRGVQGGRPSRLHLPATMVVAVALVIGCVSCVSSGAPSHSGAIPAPPVGVLTYHVMPMPADRTAITVRFGPGSSRGGHGGLATGPFRECPVAGADTSCGELIQVIGGKAVILADHGQGPYDGSAAMLIGVLNSSRRPVSALEISANTGVFAFNGLGLCNVRYRPDGAECPFGSTGYEGPGTGFSGIGGGGQSGTVEFSPPIAPGKARYFSLAQALAAGVVTGGGPTAPEQAGAPNPSESQADCWPAEPVNCATGAFWKQFTDLVVPGLGIPLDLTRTYSSGAAGTDSPFGFGWSFSYGMSLATDPAGNVTVRQENGSVITFTPGPSGGYTAPRRVMATLVRVRGGYALYRPADQEWFGFTKAGRLSWEEDLDGDETTLSYAGNELASVISPSGRTLTFVYNGPHLTKLIDPIGRVESFGYDAAGDLVSSVNPDGDRWQFGYAPGHLLTSITDPRGLVTKVQYNSAGQVVSVRKPNGASTTWAYTGNAAAPRGGTTVMTSPDRGTTTYDFSALELMAVTYGTGTAATATTSYTYDLGAHAISQTDPGLNVTGYAYDGQGDLLSTIDPLGNQTTYTYNQYGEVRTITQPGGAVSRYLYNSGGNLVKVTDPLGNTTTYAYNRASPSEVTSVSGPAGHRVAFTYDQHGDVTSLSTFPASGIINTTDYAYNGYDELACEVPPAATGAQVTCPPPGSKHARGTYAYAYNWAGQLVSEIDPAGHLTTMRHDHDGNLLVTTDPVGNTTTYTYNSENQQKTVTVNGTTTAVTTYDPVGDQLTQANAAGDVTSYQYDPLGQVVAMTNPLGLTTTYRYDRVGNQTTIAGPAGHLAVGSYDADGELTAVRYGQARSPAVTYQYYPDGQRSAMTDQTGDTEYTYDANGRLTVATHTSPAGASSTYSYAYDDARDRVTLTYPNGQRAASYYNGSGLLTTVRDWLGHDITFRYGADGNLTTETLPGGTWIRYAATSITVTRGGNATARFTYAINGAGRITSTGSTGVPGASSGPVQVAYTRLGQLASAGGASYGYNKAGELDSLPSGTSQTFNLGGELLKDTPSATSSGASSPATSYSYDDQGNRIAVNPPNGNHTALTYNPADELESYQTSGTTIGYAYNGDGLMTTRTAGGVTTDLTWDQSPATPQLLADGATSYLYGPGGQPIEQITDGTPTFLIADQHGNVRLLANGSGGIVGTYSYNPFGVTTSHTGTATTSLQYDGQYTDPQTGYIYLRARYYDPATGQFLTQDPDVALTRAPYQFAGNDPVNAADPTGLSWWNPFSWSGHTWLNIGLGVGVLVGAVFTDGADLPLLGVVAGSEDAVAAGAVGGEVATGAAELTTTAADVATADAATADVATADGVTADAAASDASTAEASAAPPPPPESQLVQALKYAKAFVGGFGVGTAIVKFAQDVVNAIQTCSSARQSVLSCVLSGGRAAHSGQEALTKALETFGPGAEA